MMRHKRYLAFLLSLLLLAAIPFGLYDRAAAVDTQPQRSASSANASADDRVIHNTRGEVIYFLWTLAGSPAPAASYSPYYDVSTDEYYASAVIWAYEKGISGGASQNSFAPESPCTNGAFASWLWRAAGRPSPDNLQHPFQDLSESTYYYTAAVWTWSSGTIEFADDQTRFYPNEAPELIIYHPKTQSYQLGCKHLWSEWDIDKPSTITTYGTEKRTCVLCGANEYKSIPNQPFADLSEGEYYYIPVLWAINHEPQITNGMTSTEFKPFATCTRGQVVTFLWRAAGCPSPQHTDNPFTDVRPDDYYYKAVLWANETNITKGTSETTFSPDAPCTRAHAVTFLWRAQGASALGAAPFDSTVVYITKTGHCYHAANCSCLRKSKIEISLSDAQSRGYTPCELCMRNNADPGTNPAGDTTPVADSFSGFSDVRADSYYASAVLWAVENGITNGVSPTTFCPDNLCTRGQIVTFLYRAMV